MLQVNIMVGWSVQIILCQIIYAYLSRPNCVFNVWRNKLLIEFQSIALLVVCCHKNQVFLFFCEEKIKCSLLPEEIDALLCLSAYTNYYMVISCGAIVSFLMLEEISDRISIHCTASCLLWQKLSVLVAWRNWCIAQLICWDKIRLSSASFCRILLLCFLCCNLNTLNYW